jgi:hypothetical protein
MLVRRIAGFAGAGVAAWMLWETITPIMRQISLGSDLATELLNPPVSLLRIVSTALLIIGGLLALGAIRGAVWVFCAGALVFALMTGAMISLGADYTVWADEAILAPFLLVICGVLLFCPRK